MSTSRFYLPDSRFRVIQSGSLLAGFTFVDNETGLEYNDWKLVQGPTGPFVSSPSRKYEHQGQTKYSNFVQAAYDKTQDNNQSPKGRSYLDELNEVVIAKYNAAKNAGGGSARGPVTSGAAVGGGDTDTDDLPF